MDLSNSKDCLDKLITYAVCRNNKITKFNVSNYQMYCECKMCNNNKKKRKNVALKQFYDNFLMIN